MYQVFELQRAAFDASVSKMVNEYEKKFVPQAEAISAYDVEIDERTKEIDNSISLIRELIKTELSNCDLMDEVLNYLKIYDHSLVIDARNILNGADVVIDLVEKDLDIINKTNYDERDNKDDSDNDRPTFIEKDNIDDDEADTRHDLIKDIIDPVAGEDGPLGSKGPVDTDAITEAIKEKNKEEAEAKQKAADEAKTEAERARQKAEEAKAREEAAKRELEDALKELNQAREDAQIAAEKGENITVIVSDTNVEFKPGDKTQIDVRLEDIDNFITEDVLKEKINAAIEAAQDALANGATEAEAISAATAAANKVDEEHSSVVDKISDIFHGRTQEYKEATSEIYGISAVEYVENQIAAQEAAAGVAGAQQRYEDALEAAKKAGQDTAELERQFEQAKQEADVRQAEADAAADSGAENSGGGEGNCDSSCDSAGCDTGGSCDSNPGCDSCTSDGCKRDSCDGGCDCDRDPACGKDGICGSDSCRRETDD